jgi:hypothetical protein
MFNRLFSFNNFLYERLLRLSQSDFNNKIYVLKIISEYYDVSYCLHFFRKFCNSVVRISSMV